MNAELEALSTEELRHRAFELAESRHDVRFFWDLIQHLPAAVDVATEDGSAGNITASITETVELVRGLFGKGADYSAVEPLLRARYLEYLTAPG